MESTYTASATVVTLHVEEGEAERNSGGAGEHNRGCKTDETSIRRNKHQQRGAEKWPRSVTLLPASAAH
jgi:hypothetical protein